MPCELELIGLNGPTVWLMGVHHFGPSEAVCFSR